MSTVDYIRAMFGQDAVHVPAWLYVQDQGSGIVSFVGASKPVTDLRAPHPLRYGSDRTHQLVAGDLVFRPQLVVGTDTLRGTGLGGLAVGGHRVEDLLTEGEIILNKISG